MTTEELKKLKVGDEIFIRARYKKTYADGDVSFLHSNTNVYDVEIEMESYTHPQNVILPSELQPAPKYDPCRPFKEGDEVRVVENKGRKQKCSGSLATVKNDEEENKVLITIDGDGIWWIDAAYLELITPAEEREPYFVNEDATSWQLKKGKSLCARYGKATHPHAKEAAEAECARLNAEHRKEKA